MTSLRIKFQTCGLALGALKTTQGTFNEAFRNFAFSDRGTHLIAKGDLPEGRAWSRLLRAHQFPLPLLLLGDLDVRDVHA